MKKEAGVDFPTDPEEQLGYAIDAVFKSWNGRRAKDYRRMEKIPDDLGTAVNVQTMVFGNKGDDSGTGVAFTRNPSTGEHKGYGDFLVNAQGEDVVAGIRITEPLDAMGNEFPGPHEELLGLMQLLENHYRDMCDIEFTIEQGRLFMLQTRVGKRTAAAALRMAVEMVDEGLIDTHRSRAAHRSPRSSTSSCTRSSTRRRSSPCSRRASNASPGAAVGKVYFTADDAEARHEAGEHVILVRPETSPDDLHGMIAAEGILTSRGGLVSHAAVVARGMGKPAICGAEAVKIDLAARTFTAGDTTVREGEVISINGTTGEIVVGEVAGHHARAERSVRHHPRLGRRAAHVEGAHQRRPPRGRAQGARVRRRGHRPVPHRAHVPRRPAPDRAAHDPRRHSRRRGRRARGAARRNRSPTSRASSRRWTGCRSPCACSTRRCTSSCPITRS